MATSVGEKNLWFQTKPGEEWALLGYCGSRHTTWVMPLLSNQVTK